MAMLKWSMCHSGRDRRAYFLTLHVAELTIYSLPVSFSFTD